MKFLLLAFLLSSVFFKPDQIDEIPYIKNNQNGIFKVNPEDSGGLRVQHTDKQVYNWIASSVVPEHVEDM